MKKIIMHWTAGSYTPSFFDRQFYHYLVDGNGKTHHGIYPPEANLNVKTGKYAAHCGGANTAAIGVALCAMAGFVPSNTVVYDQKSNLKPVLLPATCGKYPIKKVQLEAFLQLCARLSLKYDIEVTKKNVFTHFEFGLEHPQSSSAGKVDIAYLPPYPSVLPHEVGSFLRSKIRWYRLHGDKS